MSILARLGWARDPDEWTVRCWDDRGRRSTVRVRLGHGYVVFEASSEQIHLSPLQAGRLRGALKDALLDLDMLGGEQLPSRVVSPPSSVVVPAQARRAVVMHPPQKTTVRDIADRLSPSSPTGETAGASRNSSSADAVVTRAWSPSIVSTGAGGLLN